MRIFRLYKGDFKGEHKIYESREEFIQKSGLPEERILLWRNVDPDIIQAGDWIESDDGYIIQCLKKGKFVDTRGMGILPRWYVKTVSGSFRIWERKNMIPRIQWNKMLAMVATIDTGSLSGRSKLLRKLEYDSESGKRIMFATYLLMGVSLTKSYFLAFPEHAKRGFGGSGGTKRAMKVLMQEDVQQHLKTHLNPFVDKLKNKFTEDRLIDELDELLTHSKKGSDAHRGNLEFIMNIVGRNPIEKKSKKDSDEVPYEEVPPPMLGSSSV